MGTLAVVSQILLALAGVFLMIVVLLQRGRGGGLAGAFGGLGGQSAFGTKAGDVFTKITIVIAIIWVVLAGIGGYLLREASVARGASSFQGNVKDDTGEDGAGALPGEGDLDVPVAPELEPDDTGTPASGGAAATSRQESESPAGASNSSGDSPAGAPDNDPASAADSPREQ